MMSVPEAYNRFRHGILYLITSISSCRSAIFPAGTADRHRSDTASSAGAYINITQQVQHVFHASGFAEFVDGQLGNGAEQAGRTVLPVAVIFGSVARAFHQAFAQQCQVAVILDVQHRVKTQCRFIWVYQIQDLDAVAPLLQVYTVLIQKAALGQQHYHALVLCVQEIGLLLAPGCNDHFLPDKLNQF